MKIKIILKYTIWSDIIYTYIFDIFSYNRILVVIIIKLNVIKPYIKRLFTNRKLMIIILVDVLISVGLEDEASLILDHHENIMTSVDIETEKKIKYIFRWWFCKIKKI